MDLKKYLWVIYNLFIFDALACFSWTPMDALWSFRLFVNNKPKLLTPRLKTATVL